MHVTLDIDDDVLENAMKIAERQNRPVDSIISDLARLGMTTECRAASPGGYRFFSLRSGGTQVTPERIIEIQEELDMEDMLKAMGR